ncbi:MAG: hypothetical protein AAGC69_04215 [Paracraurococcus sp.]
MSDALPGRRETAIPTRHSGKIAVLLIDDAALTREGLVRLLAQGAPDFELRALARVGDIPDDRAWRPDVVLLNIRTADLAAPAVQDSLGALNGRIPDALIIVLAERDEASAALDAIRLGLRGFFPASLGVGLLVAAVRLVAAGGWFVAPAVVRQLTLGRP